MSNNEIMNLENRIQLLQQYEATAKDFQEKADEIKDSIKEQMAMLETEEIVTPNFVVRFIDVLSSRFDTKRFKAFYGDEIYNSFLKQVASKRFTIS